MKVQVDTKGPNETAPPGWRRTLCLWVPALLVTIVASALLVRYTGPIPNMDYWYMIPGLLSDHGLHLSPGAFLALSNDHVVIVPKLVYAINYCLTAGNNVGLTLWTAACAAATLGLVVKVTGKAGAGLLDTVLFSLAIAVFIFNPLAAHNFFWGMSGVGWVTANLLAVFSLFAFSNYLPEGKRVWMWGAVCALLLASITYSTGLMAWICVAGFAFVFPRSRRTSYVFAAMFMVMMLAMMVALAHTKTFPKVYDPVKVAGYAVMYIGGALTPTPGKAVAFGCLGFFLLAEAVLASWRKWSELSENQRLIRAFWFALAAYAVLNALLTGVGRSAGSGNLFPAVSGRYATLPSLYWIALLGLAASMLRGWPLRVASVVGLLAAVYVVHASIPRVKTFVHGAAQQRAAALGLYLDVKDDAVIKASMITYWPRYIYKARARLKEAGHVPFDGMFSDCPKIGSRIHAVPGRRLYLGYVDRVTKLGARGTHMDGWIAWKASQKGDSADTPGTCLALAADNGRVVGLAQLAPSRPDVRKALDKNYRNRAWIGYVVKRARGEVRVYGRDRKGSWHLMK